MEADLDNRFHLTITKATMNPIMQITMEPIYSLLPRMRNYIHGNIDGEKANTLKFHHAILDAIRRQDGDQSQLIMKDHLERTREIYISHMNSDFN
ncbi:MAG: FCD domain-containing protein [Bacteroidales bacterium]|nr:FCD domain-containing protein [Bacteroidales bacterium]